MIRPFTRHTHSQRLERWFGAETVEALSRSMRDWYGPPIAIAGAPGTVWAMKGGDFKGLLTSGEYQGALDFSLSRVKRVLRGTARRQLAKASMGFSSWDDLIQEGKKGNRVVFPFQKDNTGTVPLTGVSCDLWSAPGSPVASSVPAGAPGGTVDSSATTGALGRSNPTFGSSSHLFAANVLGTTSGTSGIPAFTTLLLYDRLFEVNKTMNSTATEAVTGVPTRYTGTTAGADDSAEGNILMIECRTTLAATAHNWTVCQYTDQGGATAVALPSVTGRASNNFGNYDMPTGSWFCPLATGDTGIKALTQMQCSALVATGVIVFAIGHPLAFVPCLLADSVCRADGIFTSFNLTRVFDNACISFAEICKGATIAGIYTGTVEIVTG